MKAVNFAFVVHNHQPIGNFEKVIESAYRDCYKPFLDVAKRFPEIKFIQHYSGALLEWLNDRHPEFISEIRNLIRRNQLELLTGAFYESILPIIPEEDRIGQIRKLSTRIGELFDYRPRGMWLAERVWEPHLVATLSRAGVEYVLLDDVHFRIGGLDDDQLVGHYRTEEAGKMIDVFPIDKTLRYYIPFHAIDETRHYLQTFADERHDRLIVHADDGEKFGVWPHTHESVYEEGWLESFFTFLTENREWARSVHLSDMIDARPPRGRHYFPTATYQEMMKWVLPSPAFLRLEQLQEEMNQNHSVKDAAMFIHGGFWRNFLVKYPEVNHMHKKMLRVAGRIRSATLSRNAGAEALDHLWSAQCNDAYWHGVFGGLYLPNIRYPIYHNLLKAENLLEGSLETETCDFDCDGTNELIVESGDLNLYFKPGTGGHLVELDYKPAALNLLDILSRREEGYHRRLIAGRKGADNGQGDIVIKEEGLEKELHFDWYRRASLVDHFLAGQTTLDEFHQSRYLELGDFVNQPYESSMKRRGSVVTISMHRDGLVWNDETAHRLTVRKLIRYKAETSTFSVDYEIQNGEEKPIDLWFAVELNVGLMAGDSPDRYYTVPGRTLADRRLRSMGEETGVRSVSLTDEWMKVETTFQFSRPAVLWRCPIETASLSETGLERVYQSSTVLPGWRFRLKKDFRVRIDQSLNLLSSGAPGRKKVRGKVSS